MGQCCEEVKLDKNTIQQYQAQIIDNKVNLKTYQQVEMDHGEIQNVLNNIGQKEQFKIIFEKNKLMKHKNQEKYYIGQWNIEGFPQGKGVIYEPHSYVYYGQVSPQPNGKGTIELYRQDLIYQGQFKKGRAQGHGTIRNTTKTFQFKGIMKQSYPSTGTIILFDSQSSNKCITIDLNNFPENKSKIVYEDGKIYEGFINKRTFRPEGQGTANFPDNSHYQGHWEDGEMHGEGSFYWPDGSSYHGNYQHGKKHGIGHFNFHSKNYYQGSWANGKKNGPGTLFSQTGQKLKEGRWHDNVLIEEDRNE